MHSCRSYVVVVALVAEVDVKVAVDVVVADVVLDVTVEVVIDVLVSVVEVRVALVEVAVVEEMADVVGVAVVLLDVGVAEVLVAVKVAVVVDLVAVALVLVVCVVEETVVASLQTQDLSIVTEMSVHFPLQNERHTAFSGGVPANDFTFAYRLHILSSSRSFNAVVLGLLPSSIQEGGVLPL